MVHLSDEKKWAIISSWKRKASISAVARELAVSRETVRRWVKAYATSSSVHKQQPKGRRASMSAAAASAAMDLLCSNTHGGAAGVARKLHSQGLTSRVLHRTTVVRHAKAAAKAAGTPIKVVRGKPGKLLTNSTKAKRLAFARANRARHWASVLFTDRCKFHFHYPGVPVQPQQWLKHGTSCEAFAVNHAQTVNLYCGISRFGVTDCHIVAGTSKHKSSFTNKQGQPAKNITSQEYEAVVKSTLLPGGRKLFSTNGISSWVLQQDNDPTHKVAGTVIMEWNKKHSSSIKLLPNWPPNSPDLNPIENVWSYVQAKVNAKGCKTFEQFKEAVLFELKHIPTSMISKLYKSMPKRMAKVIALDGGKTGY